MRHRICKHRTKRLTRWVREFIKEYPPKTDLDKEVLKYLQPMSQDGVEWRLCQNKDGLETILYIFMGRNAEKPQAHRYYYGRVYLSGIVFHLGASKKQKEVLRREIESIICEILVLIEEGVESGQHTGKAWNGYGDFRD